MSEITFIGEPIYTSSKREYYTGFKNTEGSDAQLFEVGSFVSLLPSEEEPDRRFVCIIERIWKALRKSTDESGFVEKKNQAYIRVRWFYFTEDHPKLANHSRNEVFYSFHNDTNSCLSVVSPVSVTFMRDWDLMPSSFGENNYFCTHVFDPAVIRGSPKDEDRLLLITDISNQKDLKKDLTKDWKKDWKNEIEGIKSIINRKGEPIKLWGLGSPKEDGSVALKKTHIQLIWEELPKTSATIIYKSCFAFHMFKPDQKLLKKGNTNDFIDIIGNPDDFTLSQEVLENNDNHTPNNKNHKNNKITKKVSSPKLKLITKPKSPFKSPKLSPRLSPVKKSLEIVLKEKKIPKKITLSANSEEKSKNRGQESVVKKEKKEEKGKKAKKENAESKTNELNKVDSESESDEQQNQMDDVEKTDISINGLTLYDRLKQRPIITSFKLKKPLSNFPTHNRAPSQEKKAKTNKTSKESPPNNTTKTNKPIHKIKAEKNQPESVTKDSQSTSSTHSFSKTTPSQSFVSLHFPSVVSIDSTRDPRLKQSNDHLLPPTTKLPTPTSFSTTSTFDSPPYVPFQIESDDDYFFDLNNHDENTNTTNTYENDNDNNNDDNNDNNDNNNKDNNNSNNSNDTNSNPFSNLLIFSQVAAFAASLPKSSSVNSVESLLDDVDTSIPPPKTEMQYEYEPCLTPLPSPKIQVKPPFEIPHITHGLMNSTKDILADIFSPEICSCNIQITLKNVTLNDFPIQFQDLDEKKKESRKSDRDESSEDDSYIDDRSKRRKSGVETSEPKKDDSKVDELKVITTKSNEVKLSEPKLSEIQVSEAKVSERKETVTKSSEVKLSVTQRSETKVNVQQSDKEITISHVNQAKSISLDLQTIPPPPSISSIPPPPPSMPQPPPVNLALSSNVMFPSLQVFPMSLMQPHIMQPNVMHTPNTMQSNVIPAVSNINQPVQQSVVTHNPMFPTAFNFPVFHVTQNDINFIQTITLNRNFLQYLSPKPNFGTLIQMFLIRVSIQAKPAGTQVVLAQICEVVDDIMSPYMFGDRMTRRGLKVRLDGGMRVLKLENISNQSPQPVEIANFCSEVFYNRIEFPPQFMIDAIAAEKRAFLQTKV